MKSLIRRIYAHEGSDIITTIPPVGDFWSPSLQTLEGHSGEVFSVVFSHDSTRLASASWGRTIKVWNCSNGDCLQTLTGLRRSVGSVVFSQQSRSDVMSEDSTIAPGLHYQSIGISADGCWVTRQSQRVLWLPSEHRPIQLSVSAAMAGMGTGVGKIWTCKFPWIFQHRGSSPM
jgi:hypothetical protein